MNPLEATAPQVGGLARKRGRKDAGGQQSKRDGAWPLFLSL